MQRPSKNRWFIVAALSAAGCGGGPAGLGVAGSDGSGMDARGSPLQVAADGGTSRAGAQQPADGGAVGPSARAAVGGMAGSCTAISCGDLSAAGQGAANSGTSAAATSGAGGATGAQTAQGELSVDAGVYTFKQGRRTLAVDAQHGARITRFGLDDQNLLSGPDIDMLNFGSTFWPSPQARWSWPPVPELDSDAYAAKQEADAVSFTSQAGMRAKVSVSKRIRALAAEGSIEITYSLTNNDSTAVSWAAWEITRVAAAGLSFFPSGSRTVETQLPVVEQGGVTWFQHQPAKIMGDGQKLTADGAEGWLAHVAGRTLFVKQFADVPTDTQAPAPEAEIGLYAARGYVEIEPQGPYSTLMPGEALTWNVRWLVAELPAQLDANLGSPALLDFVRQLIAHPKM